MGMLGNLFGRKSAPAGPSGPGQPIPHWPWLSTGSSPGGWLPPRAIDRSNANRLPGNAPSGIPNVPSYGYLDIWGIPQPLPMTLGQQIAASPSTRYQPFSAHSFIHARLPDPGSPAWTFETLGLVEFSPIGPGLWNRGEIKACEGAPLFPNQLVPIQGLGGVVMGEPQLQSLVLDPIATADLQS